MSQRVFVKVVGFTDVERHALNTLFRLSEQGPVTYSLWMPDAPQQPRLALVDGQSYEAPMAVESPGQDPDLKVIWVGEEPPALAWRVFDRPLHWPHVIKAMDGLLGPPQELDFDLEQESDLDFDLDSGLEAEDTQPQPLGAQQPPEPVRRALIISADLAERLYLRARLALADLPLADEAESAAQAIEMTRADAYAVTLLDFDLPSTQGWEMVKQLQQARPRLPHLIVIKRNATLMDNFRAWNAEIEACLGKPPDPARLAGLLEKV